MGPKPSKRPNEVQSRRGPTSKGVDRFGRQVPGKPRIGSSHHDDYIDVERMAHTFAGGHNRLSMETPDDLVARSRDRCTPKRHDQQ